jgi:hypothetical protein
MHGRKRFLATSSPEAARLKDYLTNSARFSPHQRLVVLDKVDYSRPRQYKAQSNAYGTGPRMSANDPKRTYGTRPGHGVADVGYGTFRTCHPLRATILRLLKMVVSKALGGERAWAHDATNLPRERSNAPSAQLLDKGRNIAQAMARRATHLMWTLRRWWQSKRNLRPPELWWVMPKPKPISENQ